MQKFSLLTLISAILILGLTACNSGYNNTIATALPTYTFTGYTSSVTGSGCSLVVSPFTCSAESSTLSISISYTGSTPPAYVAIPVQSSLPVGVTITTTGPCQNANTQSQTVGNYACTINISAESAASGSSISIPYNGSLGPQTLYNINFQ